MRTASFLCISVALHAAALAYPAFHNAPEKVPPLLVTIVEAEGGGGNGENSSAEKPGGGRATDAPPHKPIKHAASSNATPPRDAVPAAPVETARAAEPAPIAAPAEPVALPSVETQTQSAIAIPVRESTVTVALEGGAALPRTIAEIGSSSGGPGSTGVGSERGSGSGAGTGNGSGGSFGAGQGSGSGDGDARFVPVSYASCPKADYPEAARREGWEGTVMIEVAVDEEGRPRSSRVQQSSGFAVLDRAALDNI